MPSAPVAGPAAGAVHHLCAGQTKEAFPKVGDNPAIARGMHILSMDGPGQGSSSLRKIRAVGDNYERADAAVIDWLSKALLAGETNARRIAYVAEGGGGPFGDCQWTPTVGPGEAYF